MIDPVKINDQFKRPCERVHCYALAEFYVYGQYLCVEHIKDEKAILKTISDAYIAMGDTFKEHK